MQANVETLCTCRRGEKLEDTRATGIVACATPDGRSNRKNSSIPPNENVGGSRIEQNQKSSPQLCVQKGLVGIHTSYRRVRAYEELHPST